MSQNTKLIVGLSLLILSAILAVPNLVDNGSSPSETILFTISGIVFAVGVIVLLIPKKK